MTAGWPALPLQSAEHRERLDPEGMRQVQVAASTADSEQESAGTIWLETNSDPPLSAAFGQHLHFAHVLMDVLESTLETESEVPPPPRTVIAHATPPAQTESYRSPRRWRGLLFSPALAVCIAWWAARSIDWVVEKGKLLLCLPGRNICLWWSR